MPWRLARYRPLALVGHQPGSLPVTEFMHPFTQYINHPIGRRLPAGERGWRYCSEQDGGSGPSRHDRGYGDDSR